MQSAVIHPRAYARGILRQTVRFIAENDRIVQIYGTSEE